MKIIKFEWLINAPRFKSANITIREGWWFFATEEVHRVVRLPKYNGEGLGNWWLLSNGQDIDIPAHFYEDNT